MTENEEMKVGIEAREELERAHYEACQETDHFEEVYAETGCPDANNLAHRPETCPQVDDLPF